MPLSAIALTVSLIDIISSENVTAWDIALTLCLILCTVVLFVNYIKSIRFLKNAVKEESIFEYLRSERKEYRKFSDNLPQNNFDNDIYL